MKSMFQKEKYPSFLKDSIIQRHRSSIDERSSYRNAIRKSKFIFQTTQICSLCQVQYQLSQMTSINSCEHFFCSYCLIQYITYKINVMEDVLCPEEGCEDGLEQSCPIYGQLANHLKEKWERYKFWKLSLKNPNLKLCPSEKCNLGLINMDRQSPDFMICKKCKKVYCKQCMMEKHQGKCSKNFQQKFNEWKRCPRCYMFIERPEGCNHMTCKCSYQFCYVCLSIWTQQHYECENNRFQEEPFCVNQEALDNMSKTKRYLIGFCLIFIFPFAIIGCIVGGIVSFILILVFSILVSPFFYCEITRDCPIFLKIIAIIFFPVVIIICIFRLQDEQMRRILTVLLSFLQKFHRTIKKIITIENQESEEYSIKLQDQLG